MEIPDGPIEYRIARILTNRDLTLSVAESATGGRIADYITNVPGSSKFFLGGVIAYHNSVKTKLLMVSKEVLSEHGAVSAEAASAMAIGVLHLLGSDIGIATTGITGPTGATINKPVGLVYVAFASAQHTSTKRFVFSSTREDNKEEFAKAALELLEEGLCPSHYA